MNSLKQIFGLLLALLVIGSAGAQDRLSPLRTNPQLQQRVKKQKRAVRAGDNRFVFLIDTLEIPIVDDFSTNRMKTYEPVAGDSFEIGVEWLADGLFLDSLLAKTDTSFNLVIQGSGDTTLVATPAIEVVFFSAENDPLLPTDTTYLWTTFITVTDPGGGITQDTLDPDVLLENLRDSVFFVPDDNSLWVDSKELGVGEGAYINQTFGFQPPTIGVATLDGLNPYGLPYNDNFGSSRGLADSLSSKPIDLERDPITQQPYANVYFSFFFQPEGFGDKPELGDSLVLQFYAPESERWESVWRTDGGISDIPVFEQVFIPITASRYLRRGFRFRFVNYATLSGSLDHWHIDYVRLGADRSAQEDVIVDVAFMRQSPSFIRNYTSMPWRHFRASPASFIDTLVEHRQRNLHDIARFVTDGFQVLDDTGNPVFTLNPGQVDPNVAAQSIFSFPLVVDPTANLFPVNNNERARFTVVNTTSSSPDVNNFNDTARFEQVFDTYYAYDDGTAERGYSLIGAGAKLAYVFSLSEADTLKGLHMYFPPILEDIRDREFQIMVWRSIIPEDPIYEGPLRAPVYAGINEFTRYELEEQIPLEAGVYWVGWKQLETENIYLGFDRNTDNQDKIWFNAAGTWQNASFSGSVMMRPDFGVPPPPPAGVSESAAQEPLVLSVYPNPARTDLNVHVGLESHETAILSIHDIQGRQVYYDNRFNGRSLNIEFLPEGIYLLRVASADGGNVASRKVLISR